VFRYHSRIVGLVSGLRGSNGTFVFSDPYTDSCLIYAFASLVHHHCLELSQPSEFRIGASYPLASSLFHTGLTMMHRASVPLRRLHFIR